MCILPEFKIIFKRCWCRGQTNWIRPSESGAWTPAFCQSSLEFAAARWVLWGLALEPQAPALALTPGNVHLQDQMSFASLSQNKSESHWHHLLQKFSWAYSSWRKEKKLLSWVRRQERVFCVLFLFWNKPHSEFSDPGKRKLWYLEKANGSIFCSQVHPPRWGISLGRLFLEEKMVNM